MNPYTEELISKMVSEYRQELEELTPKELAQCARFMKAYINDQAAQILVAKILQTVGKKID